VLGLGDAIALPAAAMQRWLARFDARYRAEGAASSGWRVPSASKSVNI
jgi:hypothetical protein